MSGRRVPVLAVLATLLASTGLARADDVGGTIAWDLAREQLRVQIRRESDPRAPGAIAREDLLGTRTVLVRIPEPAADAIDVTAEVAAAWGQPPDALFLQGLDNLERKQPPLFRRTPELKEGVEINLLYGEHPFAAAYVLAVEHYPTCMGNKGALVAIPNRHATLCYPVESSRAFYAYLALVNMAVAVQFEGEAPLVPHVYWYHDGTFEAQPVRIEGQRHVVPQQTDAFNALMKKLPDDVRGARRRRR